MAKEQKTMTYIDARQKQLQDNLIARSSELENIELQFATEMSLSEDALRIKAIAKVERAREEEMERARNFILELARLG